MELSEDEDKHSCLSSSIDTRVIHSSTRVQKTQGLLSCDFLVETTHSRALPHCPMQQPIIAFAAKTQSLFDETLAEGPAKQRRNREQDVVL